MVHGPSVEEEVVRDLANVMARFQGDSRQAFGLGPRDDAGAVRAAFMKLCKRYHPAKFARYSPPTVRLANEAFLLIRRAHDLLQRDLAPTVTPPGGRIATPPAGVPTVVNGRGRAATPPTGVPTVPSIGRGRVATPPTGVATLGAGRVPPSTGEPSGPVTGRVQVTPPTTGVGPTTAATRQPIPGVRDPRVASTQAGSARAASTQAGQPARGPSLRPQLDQVTPTDQTFERALDHLRAKRWADARPLLSELAQGAPSDPRFRAYLHYLRGWEAFELGKDGEARSEWRRALACDPGLGMAQWALAKTGLG